LDISRHSTLFPVSAQKNFGLSVRCLKNSFPEKPDLTAISGNSSVILNWNIPFNGGSEIKNYLVQFKLSSSETWTIHSTVNSTATTTNVTNLQNGISYDFRIAAVNDIGTGVFSNVVKRTSNLDNCGIEINDVDGNIYTTVLIGNQCWFKKNLNTSRFRNGGLIRNIVNNSDWESNKTGAWSYYNNNEVNNAVYGKLYNWYTTLGDSLCPIGWHVPTDVEWTILSSYLGISGGNKLKSIGTTYWNSPNTGATNESGFSALGGGVRGSEGGFYDLKGSANFWSSTESMKYFGNIYAPGLSVWVRAISFNHGEFMRHDASFKPGGLSIRCLKN